MHKVNQDILKNLYALRQIISESATKNVKLYAKQRTHGYVLRKKSKKIEKS